MDDLQIKNHYGKYSKKNLHKLVIELYNDNVQLNGQLKSAVKQLDKAVAKNIELALKLEKLNIV